MAAIVVGVAGVAWAAPERTTDHAGTGAIALALGLVAIPIAAAATLLREGRAIGARLAACFISAGFGYAWTAIASELFTEPARRRARCSSRSPGLPPRRPPRAWRC